MNQQQEKDVWDLVYTLTDKKQGSLDSDALRSLKSAVKRTPSAAVLVWQLLREQLQHEHAQTRLLALEVCDVFFARSQTFRSQLSQHFTSFMAATVGHQQEQPLPGPASTAATLRTKALAAIERWQQQWGQYYPQVTLGHRYLKHTLRLTFPNISAALARRAAQQAQQHARTQALLQQHYTALLADLPSLQQQVQALAQQLDSGTALLRSAAQLPPAPEAAAAAVVVSAGASSSGGQAAATPASQQAPERQQQGEEQHPEQQPAANEVSEDFDMEELLGGEPLGLAAYAVDRVGLDGGQEGQQQEELGAQLPWDLPPEAAATCSAVRELLGDVGRQLALLAQQVQRGLRVVSQVEASDAQARERQQLLHQLVSLKQQIQEHLQAAAAASGLEALTRDALALEQAQELVGDDSAAALPDGDPSQPLPGNSNGNHSNTPAGPAAAIELPWPVRGSLGGGEVHTTAAPQRRTLTLHAQLQPRGVPPPPGPLFGALVGQGATRPHQQASGGAPPHHHHQQQQQQRKRKPPAPPPAQVSAPKAASPYVIPWEVVRAAEEGRLSKRPHLDDDSNGPRQPATGGRPEPPQQPAITATQQQQAASQPDCAGGEVSGAAGDAVGARGSGGGRGPSQPKEGLPQQLPGAPAGNSSTKSNLSEDVRARLLAAAPVVEGVDGDQWVGARHALTSSRISCEVYNHWGRADPDVELPQHRVNELLGQMPMYYTVKHPQQQQQQQQQQEPVQQQQQEQVQERPAKQQQQQQQEVAHAVQQQGVLEEPSRPPGMQRSAAGGTIEEPGAALPRGIAVTRIGKPRPWQKPPLQTPHALMLAAVAAAAAGAAAAGAVAGVMAPPPPVQQQQQPLAGGSTPVPAPHRPAPASGSAIDRQLRAAAQAAAAAVKCQASATAKGGRDTTGSSSSRRQRADATSYNMAVMAMAAASTGEALATRLQQEEEAAAAAGAAAGGSGAAGARQRKPAATKGDLVRKKLLGL